MNYETLFTISNFLTMPFWFLMVFLPRRQWTKRIIGSVWIVAPAAVAYTAVVVPQVGTLPAELANPTLPTVQALLGTPQGATAGWIHFLAFDLFVGRWAYLDNLKTGRLPALLLSVILFFVLMLGPAGWLLYVVARTVADGLGRSEGGRAQQAVD